MKLLSRIRVSFKTMAIVLGITVFVVAATHADEYKYTDNWGKAGYSVDAQSKSNLTVNYSIEKFGLNDFIVDGDPMLNIELPGNLLFNDEGAPNLPGSGRYVAIPQGATASFEITSMRTEVIKNVDIAPAPRIPWETETEPMDYAKDMSIYSVNAFYPASPVQISEITEIRGVDAVMLGITPFQYNPVTKELIVYRDLKIEMTFEGGNGHFGEDRLRSRWFDPLLEDMLLNASSLPKVDYNKSFQGTDDAGCEYLIITPDGAEFQQWADSIKVFRTSQGIATDVVTISDIGGNNTTTIENYINNAYYTWDIVPTAVLLIGDYGNSGNTITSPIWDGYCVSDNIYADVTNNDMPDIIFARMAAQNESQLEVMITKFLDYERTPPTSEDFYQNPITALGFQTERWFQICSESVAGFWENEMGKTVNRINAIYSGNPLNDPWSTTSYGNTSAVMDLFGPDGLGYLPATPGEVDCSWYGTAQDVINGINDGAFILQHRDHGFESGWGEPAFQNSHINSLNNTDLTFIWSVNCLTGKYNIGSECFAEKFHRHTSGGQNSGALGLVAASEVSYSFVNDTYVWGAYDNQWPDFMPDYGATPESRDVLPAFGNAAGKYFLQQSAWPYNTNNKEVTYNLFHHFGDAFTTVYANMPQELAVTHDPVLFAGVTTFDVNANEGAFIALTVNGEIIGTATATGAPVSITIPGQIPPDQVVVTITKQDYYRYSAAVEVIPQDGPFVVRESYTINDESGNNNGMMDYGESNLLSLSVENVGIEAATGVEVTISTDDEYITLTDDTEAYGDIDAGATVVVEDGFAFDVANDLPDGHSVTFEVSATDGTDVWVSYISITGYAPVLEFAGFSISDPTGNNNGKLDPGETADITVEIENAGSSEAFAIIGNLLESDPFLTVNTDDVVFGDLMAGNTASGMFSVYAEETTPAGHMVDLDFEMAANLGIEGMGAFNVVIGQIPVIIIDMDGNGNSAQGMEEALSNMEIAYEVSSSLPPDLNLYSTIFLALGIYSNNHVLSSGEGSNLADYLNAGGNLYMEGGDTWYYDNSTAVHSMFGINGTSDGSGDLGTINGQSGTFTEDMSFSYTGDNNWIDHLEATGTGEVIFMNQSPSYGTAVSNDAGDYKTIGASHEFGGLSDGSSPSTKAELMAKYLEFFGMTGGTQVLTAIFTSDETEICAEESIAFSDLSLGSPNSWSWTFEGGSPATSSAQNPSVMYFIAGEYDVTLEVSDGTETVSITMENYITVNAAPAQAATPEGEAEICTNFLVDPVEYTTSGTDEADSYIWKLTPDEAGTISGDGLTATVTFTENWIGTAMIKVKGVNDCGEGEFSETFEVMCDICESIDESILRNSLSIFPNPTNGEFTVEFNMNIGTTQVEVVNLLNQVVYTNNVDVNSNTALKVDLSSFGDGLYFVRIKAKNSESIKKVVVR